MKRNLLLAVAAFGLALAGASGCRSPHLGTDTGLAFAKAVTAQAASDGESIDELSAADAKKISAKHRAPRGKESRDTDIPALTYPTLGTSSSSSSSASPGSGSSWGGAQGSIQLNAK